MRRRTAPMPAFIRPDVCGRFRRAGRLALTAVLLSQLVPAAPAFAQTRRPAAKRTAAAAPEAAATPEATPTPTPTPEPQTARPRLILRGAPARTRKVEPSPAPVLSGGPAQKSAPVLARPLSPSRKQTEVGPYESLTGPIETESITADSVTLVSFEELSKMVARRPAGKEAPAYQAIPSPGRAPAPPAVQGGEAQPQWGVPQSDVPQPNVPSPSPSQSFLAQEDAPKVGTGTFTIPPDTTGAVGLDKVFTQTNANFRIHNKLTGAALSTVSSETFWSSTGATGVFDPRVVYDPYQNRWIVAAVSNASSAQSSVLIGVSTTSDPQGTYLLFRVVVGAAVGSAAPFANGGWADFPMIGFNKNWVTIGYNMHAITNNLFVRGETLVLNYPALRTGVLSGSRVNLGGNFCVHPATTLSPTENTLYLLQQANPATAGLVVYTISGTPSSISIAQFGLFTRPGGGWVEPVGDILPQNCVPGSPVATFACPASPQKLETSDSNIRGNVVSRNGKLFYSQTVGIDLPGGDPIDHTAAQWTVATPTFTPAVPPSTPASLSLTFDDGGRVEDATATATNGGKWYSYTSVAVNRNNDLLLGFSEFESDDFVDAAYTFRAAGDAAGTMRDTVVFKEGEDYYDKDFGTGRNRFGDYSHAVVDPVNDADLWTIQEYAQTRVVALPPTVDNPANGLGSNSSRWSTWWAKLALASPGAEGDLVISEFRLRGPAGAEDEYVEVHNATSGAITVTTTDASAGYAIAASDGIVRCIIPNGTVIPARGHYLCTNSDGYSLAAHPAGVATNATGDASFTADIPDNVGVALFNTATNANFSLATRLDAVGSAAEANPLYREGAGYPAIATTSDLEHAFFRDSCGKGGSTSTLGPCPSGGFAVDTDDNAADFVFADTNGTNTNAGQRLGAPGPENLSSPVQRNSGIAAPNLDPAVSSTSPPNRVRDLTSDPANNSTFGTLLFRKTITNNTGAPITRLRFRLIDITTFPALATFADLRARTSSVELVSITGPNPACPSNVCAVQATTLEEPPTQPNGGGFNSSLSVGTVLLASPVPNGQSVNVQFLLGIQQTGRYKFYINVEVLP